MDPILGAPILMTIYITKRKKLQPRMKETRKEKEAKENNKEIR